MPQTIKIPLPAPGPLGLTRITAIGPGEDTRGRLVLLSDGTRTASLDRNNLAAIYDGQLPEGEMLALAIDGQHMAITFAD